MPETVKRLIINLMVWGAFGLALLGLNQLVAASQNGELNAAAALERLIEPKLVFVQVLAVILLIGSLALFADKFAGRAEGQRLNALLRIGSEEAGSILTNFGSLLIVAGFVTGEPLYPLLGAVPIYGFAYFFLFRPTGQQLRTIKFVATYPDIPEVKEEVTIEQSGSSVIGTIKPIAGPDVGRLYTVTASSRDRMLVGHFESTTSDNMDKGAFALALDVEGKAYHGHVVYTHDSGKFLREDWILTKQQ